MRKDCRDLGAEDFEEGAKLCHDCFRYKAKRNQCEDFIDAGITLKRAYKDKKGRVRWEKERR